MTGTRKQNRWLALIIVFGCLAVSIGLFALFRAYRNTQFEKKLEAVSQCQSYQQCAEMFDHEVYNMKLDDENEISWLERNFGKQKAWQKKENENVAFFPGGGLPLKYIYVVYDRTTYRVIETGWLGM